MCCCELRHSQTQTQIQEFLTPDFVWQFFITTPVKSLPLRQPKLKQIAGLRVDKHFVWVFSISLHFPQRVAALSSTNFSKKPRLGQGFPKKSSNVRVVDLGSKKHRQEKLLHHRNFRGTPPPQLPTPPLPRNKAKALA